jgi:hypothetical protein
MSDAKLSAAANQNRVVVSRHAVIDVTTIVNHTASLVPWACSRLTRNLFERSPKHRFLSISPLKCTGASRKF